MQLMSLVMNLSWAKDDGPRVHCKFPLNAKSEQNTLRIDVAASRSVASSCPSPEAPRSLGKSPLTT